MLKICFFLTIHIYWGKLKKIIDICAFSSFFDIQEIQFGGIFKVKISLYVAFRSQLPVYIVFVFLSRGQSLLPHNVYTPKNREKKITLYFHEFCKPILFDYLNTMLWFFFLQISNEECIKKTLKER